MFTIDMKRPPFRAGLGCALTLSLALCAVSANEPPAPGADEEGQRVFQELKAGAESWATPRPLR